MPLIKHKKVFGIQVFLERKKTCQYVGLLTKKNSNFHFEYDSKYVRGRTSIPLGPEMPMTARIYDSEVLFIPFSDRIPTRENPAYPDYCRITGISPDEQDVFVLLATIAHRGPSSFIFEPLYEEDTFREMDLLDFRKELGLSVKEFATVFDFSQAAITRIERKQSSGREVLKRAEIYAQYPEVALDRIRSHGGILTREKRKKIAMKLAAKIKEKS